MADLKFELAGVRRLVAATKGAATREPTYSQRHLAPDRVPPGFWLVKDEGVYLVSNGDRTRHDPVYAQGLGPKADYDLVRAIAGGDDFCTFVPVAWADEALRTLGATHMVIGLNRTTLTARPPATERPRR